LHAAKVTKRLYDVLKVVLALFTATGIIKILPLKHPNVYFDNNMHLIDMNYCVIVMIIKLNLIYKKKYSL